ncbi:protein translocase subunit SecDF [Parapedobacter indicus]|uniref:Multifunctional fusion protein n=1 Tax=Parapedobacter indicus TaxID=1477437 RepID=A0A1I3IBW0_9SPHI|nr:protein translocase subunit SecDF [Parapedobacter indicus]PPL02102.1 SecD/SecF fusion protein [Parapedobacter indicus]SFI45505.1 SecD/SecF fusion protein [Parapedobacter indicus]
MQGKGLIKFLVVVVTIACLYSLSFTFVTRKVERDAAAYAKGDFAKEKAYLDSMAGEVVYNLGIAKYTYREAKGNEIALGLDLKGGMNVTMEVSLQELVRNLANNPKDENFNKALENANVRSRTSQSGYVSLFVEEFKKLSPNATLASFFATKDNSAYVTANSTDSQVESFLQRESTNAIDNSFKVLRTRIDKFGVTSPNIQLQQGTNRILIELPGVTDEDRVRKLLQGSARLEFWETYHNVEIYPMLENVNGALAATLKETEKATGTTADTTQADSTDAGLLATLGASQDSLDASDSSANQLALQNPLFNVLRPATAMGPNNQPMLAPGPIVGYAQLRDTAKVNRYLASSAVKQIIPANVKLLWGVKPNPQTPEQLELYAVKPSGVDAGPILGGNVITDAKDDFDPQSNSPMVTMYMNSEGAREWRRITATASADANNKQAIAIVLDGVVYSAPTVQGEIPNGVSQITGNFTIEDTKDLANVLKAGRLPTTAKIVEEAVVGPSLGQAAIDAGINSSVIGLLVVLIFMIVYYNRAGLVANIAVVFNVFFIMGVLASLNAVLTLPGIAGIVLTIGTAVDANVLIYERIREELRLGKSIRQAISDGYQHAMSSILDSQITTFLTGAILFFFGSGPILGFATTLMIGIITSLFTSIFISRIIFEWMLTKGWSITVSRPWSNHTFQNANYGFVRNRRKFYVISAAVVLIGIISIFTKGFSLGVDFQGGRTYTVRFEQPVNLEEVRSNLNEAFEMNTEVKTFGGDSQVRVTTAYQIEETSDEADQAVLEKLNSGLAKIQGNDYEIASSQKVGPTIANDMKTRAIYAGIASIVVIALYILLRFRKWQFSVAAAITTVHDIVIILALFSILDGIVPFALDVDQHFVAAILTVVGYSINDTVVVFDRLREYLGLSKYKKEDEGETINLAINKTLSRTVITSLTVIFVLGVLFVFGGEVIRGFSFAILVGIIVATYSSIFLAAPLIADLDTKKLDESPAADPRSKAPLKPAKA